MAQWFHRRRHLCRLVAGHPSGSHGFRTYVPDLCQGNNCRHAGCAFPDRATAASPQTGDLSPLAVTALGVVIGFPLLTAFALQHITSAHSIVFVGLLPLCTAVFAVLRGGERPRPLFWLCSLTGAGLVVGYALMNGGEASAVGDLLMLAAVVVCGLGYAEGARLSRTLGGWQVISWALLVALPVMLLLTVVNLPAPDDFARVSAPAWLSFGYVSLFSMLIGFVFWYRGLVQGGLRLWVNCNSFSRSWGLGWQRCFCTSMSAGRCCS